MFVSMFYTGSLYFQKFLHQHLNQRLQQTNLHHHQNQRLQQTNLHHHQNQRLQQANLHHHQNQRLQQTNLHHHQSQRLRRINLRHQNLRLLQMKSTMSQLQSILVKKLSPQLQNHHHVIIQVIIKYIRYIHIVIHMMYILETPISLLVIISKRQIDKKKFEKRRTYYIVIL